jgi:phage gp36-like protein
MYTSATEIQGDFKDLTFTATSNVKDSDVTGFIVEADALINSYVGARYSVPVTSGDGLNLLKLCSRSLVSARIKKIMEVKQDKGQDANQNVVGVLLSPTAVMKILADIRDDKINLDGGTLLVSGNGFYSYNAKNDIQPVIKKDEKQW